MQSLVILGHHDWYITWPRYGTTGVKCFSQGRNDILPNSGIEPAADNLAIAYLCSYPLSCSAASWDDSVKCFSIRSCRRKYLKSKPDMLKYFNLINLVKKSEYILAKKKQQTVRTFQEMEITLK